MLLDKYYSSVRKLNLATIEKERICLGAVAPRVGAWIEIARLLPSAVSTAILSVRRLSSSVILLAESLLGEGSHLAVFCHTMLGVRELKFENGMSHSGFSFSVAPCMGAWIESCLYRVDESGHTV